MEPQSLLSEAPNPTAGDTEQSAQAQTDTGSVNGEQTNAVETNGTEAKQDEGKQEEVKPQGAPESYEEFKFEDGKALASEDLEEVKGLAKELNLSQEAAQKLAEFKLKQNDGYEAKNAQKLVDEGGKWWEQSMHDKEFGGDKLDESLAIAKKAVFDNEITTPELREMLKASKLENHPEVVRHFYRLGKKLSQDNFVSGSHSATTKPDAATMLYGKKGN